MNIITNYVAQTAERALRSGAAGALVAIGAETTTVVGWNWFGIGAGFAAGFIMEVLFSLAAQPVGDPLTPSLLPAQGTTAAHLP